HVWACASPTANTRANKQNSRRDKEKSVGTTPVTGEGLCIHHLARRPGPGDPVRPNKSCRYGYCDSVGENVTPRLAEVKKKLELLRLREDLKVGNQPGSE